MKITAEKTPYGLAFRHYEVRKKGAHFYGVYLRYNGCLITSGNTLSSAAKKAKLLEIGYEDGRADW